MKAIGIDPGTRNLGYGIVRREGNRLIHITHGVIRVEKLGELPERLVAIARELAELLEEHAPDVASVEGMFFHKDAQAAAKLGHARGVVLCELARRGLPIHEHAPARVKRTLTGNGQAEKAQVAQMVSAVLGLEGKLPPDASDALAIAMTELRLDPRAHELDRARQQAARKKMPPHLAEAIARAKAARG